METKKQREQTALNFINLHKNNIIEEWLLSASSLESIYYNLVGGVYGDTEDNSVEISSTESHTGNPIIFNLQQGNMKMVNRYDELTHVQQREVDILINTMASLQREDRIDEILYRVEQATDNIRSDFLGEQENDYNGNN